MRRIFRDSCLLIAMFALFLVFVVGQSIAGFFDYNSTEKEHERPPVSYTEYLRSCDFVDAVFENWQKRVRGGRSPGSALDLPAAEGLFPVETGCPPARRGGGMRAA